LSDNQHDQGDYEGPGIQLEVRKEIEDFFNLGIVKPSIIMDHLIKKQIQPPSRKQLYNFLHRLKVTKTPAILSLGQLAAACDDVSGLPNEEDKAFVVGRDIDFESKTFRFLLSTPRLLQNSTKSNSLQADATYKLLWYDFPVIVIGTSDKDRHFHPYGISVCSGETSEDFESVFKLLKSGCEMFGEYKPNILIADCAEAITNGFTRIFGEDITRVYCFFHVMKQVKEKLRLVRNDELTSQIKDDIRAMQLATSSEEFLKAKSLWIRKYESIEEVSEFLSYFSKEYLSRRSSWYEGAAPGSPSTNNGLESINNLIKRDGTFRRKLPLREFLQCMLKLLERWSYERNPSSVDTKHFALTPTILDAKYTSAYK